MENLRDLEGEEGKDIESIPPWTSHITIRGMFASIVIGIIYSVIVMKLNLTTGFAPNFNVSAAFVAFAFIRTWTLLLHKAGFVSSPFTKQENTVIQTCAVACYSIAFGGGFGSYVLGLNKKTYQQAGVDTEGNPPGSYKEPALGWLIGFLFVSNFVGLLALVPLRKAVVTDSMIKKKIGDCPVKLKYCGDENTVIYQHQGHNSHYSASVEAFGQPLDFDSQLNYG